MRVAVGIACLVLLGAGASCAPLSPIEANVCGNGVVEPVAGEDCDGFPEDQCRPAGAEGQCRLDCAKRTDGTRPQCPPGWGCGSDNICRRPAGQFAMADNTALSGASWLHVGDFDGDGFGDILAVGNQGGAVWYTNGNGDFSSHFDLPRAPYAPAVGDLSADHLDDAVLVTSTGDGLVIGRGKPDETLQPTVNAPYVLPDLPSRAVVIDAMPTQFDAGNSGTARWLGDELLMMVANVLAPVGDESANNSNEPLAMMPGMASEVVGDVAVGNLIEDSPCQEMAVAFRDKPFVWVYTPCRADGTAFVWNMGPRSISLPQVDLPQGDTAGGVVLADLNGDKHLDMIVNAPSADSGPVSTAGVMVAFGNGTGTFHSELATLPHAPQHGDNQATSIQSPDGDSVLAAGNLDGDDCADIVTRNGVYVTRPSCPPGGVGSLQLLQYVQTVTSGLDSWSYARIGDLNANGIPDVVLGHDSSTRMLFLNGAGEGVFNAFDIPLEGPASQLVLGDFDGDLVWDVAFRQAGAHGNVPAGVEKGDSVAVAFGNGFGAPSKPVNMGRLARIEQLAGGNLAGFYPDGIHDLVVITKSEDESTTSAAVLPGGSNRTMVSPFPLTIPHDNTTYWPVAVAIGQFDGDLEGHLDIAALSAVYTAQIGEPSTAPDLNLWVIPSSGEASLDAGMESRSDKLPIQSMFGTEAIVALDLGSQAGRLDGLDELAVLSTQVDMHTGAMAGVLLTARIEDVQAPDGKTRKTWVAGEPQTLPLLFSNQVGWGGGVGQPGPEPLSDVWSYTGDVEVGDVDGDGAKDLLVLGLDIDAQTGTGLGTAILLLRNEMNGTLDASKTIVLTNPDDENPIAIALLNADEDPELEIAVAESDHGYVADLDRTEWRLVNVRRFDTPRGVLSLTARDINGDGIDDIAAATGDRLVLLMGKAVVQ
jgi:hypothetical protein